MSKGKSISFDGERLDGAGVGEFPGPAIGIERAGGGADVRQAHTSAVSDADDAQRTATGEQTMSACRKLFPL